MCLVHLTDNFKWFHTHMSVYISMYEYSQKKNILGRWIMSRIDPKLFKHVDNCDFIGWGISVNHK